MEAREKWCVVGTVGRVAGVPPPPQSQLRGSGLVTGSPRDAERESVNPGSSERIARAPSWFRFVSLPLQFLIRCFST